MSGFTWFVQNYQWALILICVAAAVFVWNFWVWARGSWRQRYFSWAGRHVLITGASRGLGLEVAKILAEKGARLTLVARGQADLEAAAEAVTAACNDESKLLAGGDTALGVSVCDVTDADRVRSTIKAAIAERGPLYAVIPCAGMSLPGYFGEIPLEEYKKEMDVNYFGSLNVVHHAVPGMIDSGEGHLVFVSSGFAITAVMGYAAYCPAKSAVKALADVLRSELKPYNLNVYSAYPPNMNTPGFDEENKRKPPEAVAIDAGETIYEPEQCAQCLVSSVERGEYHISCGDPGINMLVRASSGLGPRNNSLTDCLLLPLLVVVGNIYLWSWDATVGATKYAGARADRAARMLAASMGDAKVGDDQQAAEEKQGQDQV